jgi:hypothetical protein
MTPQAAQTFVPLTAAPAPAARRDFAATVVPAGGAEKKFQLLNPADAGTDAGKKPCEPRVSVQRDGNRVTHLRIQCTCGQVLDLACLYDASAA